MKQSQPLRLAALSSAIFLVAGTIQPAQAAFDWRKLLGMETKPKRAWTPRRGPVFNWKALASTPLEARVLKTEVRGGIVTKQVMFHSEMDGAKKVDIFAYFSYPKRAKKLPAFIWIEGGLAQAKPYRTRFGAKRGYATLAIDFPLPGYRSTGGYPINLGMYLGENPRQAPIYHGAVALLKAVTFLENQPQVDKENIGMAGSSWGGFYTTLMTGIDPRIKAAACLFGCGNLQTGNMWWDAYGRSAEFPPQLRQHWRTSLDPAFRLPRSKTPIAWFSATNDWFFWMPALMKTHGMAAGPKNLSLTPNWDHALMPEVVDEAFAWLDAHLKGTPGLPSVGPLRLETIGGERFAVWKADGPLPLRRAELMFSIGPEGNWHTRNWLTLQAKPQDGVCKIRIPASAAPLIISGSVTDSRGFRSSTPLLKIEPTAAIQRVAHNNDDPLWRTDGAAEWGGFEKSHCIYLRRHGWLKRQSLHDFLTADAFSGKKALLLTEAETRLPILRFTAGHRHRLSFWARSESPVTVTVRLNARFNGEKSDSLHNVPIRRKWTHVTVDVDPHEDLFQRHNAAIELPPGAKIAVDAFSFRPLPPSGLPRTFGPSAI